MFDHRVLLTLLFLTTTAVGQEASRDDRVKPEQLGLPKGTTRTSEPFVTRIYKPDVAGTILAKQPAPVGRPQAFDE